MSAFWIFFFWWYFRRLLLVGNSIFCDGSSEIDLFRWLSFKKHFRWTSNYFRQRWNIGNTKLSSFAKLVSDDVTLFTTHVTCWKYNFFRWLVGNSPFPMIAFPMHSDGQLPSKKRICDGKLVFPTSFYLRKKGFFL